MKRAIPARLYLRAAMLIIALLLPLFSLAALGSLWLWQKGYLVHWAAVACLTTLGAYAAERWILRGAITRESNAGDASGSADPGWTAREKAAWEDVEGIVHDVIPATLDSRDAILALGTRTVETVARRMHPRE